MAVVVRNKRGNEVILLNPFEKGTKMFEPKRKRIMMNSVYKIFLRS